MPSEAGTRRTAARIACIVIVLLLLTAAGILYRGTITDQPSSTATSQETSRSDSEPSTGEQHVVEQ